MKKVYMYGIILFRISTTLFKHCITASVFKYFKYLGTIILGENTLRKDGHLFEVFLDTITL